MDSLAPPRADAKALEVLCSKELSDIVEMVVSSPSPSTYEARAVDGRVRFERSMSPTSKAWEYSVTETEGRNPLATQDPSMFSPIQNELERRQPNRSENSYPLAFERISQVFDHPCAPDLCVLHTPGHRPGHHRGEHGSLDVVQSRAPFVLAGRGVQQSGLIDGYCQMVDVAPTVLALLDIEASAGIGPTGLPTDTCLLSRQDGAPLLQYLNGDVAEHVVVILMDGANANVVYEAARNTTMPNVASLIDRGVGLAQGSIASLPTVTLANHTTLNTGLHPGHHGVLHNAWYDKTTHRQVVTESAATWQESMQWLFPDIETIHDAIHRRQSDAFTVSINEPAERGANYSTMELMRQGKVMSLMDGMPDPLPNADSAFVESSKDYQWGSLIDSSAVRQAVAIWEGSHLGATYLLPKFMWISFSLTDAAFHEGGPHSDIAIQSLRDTDARLGDVLAAIRAKATRAYDRTAFLLVADHGMEENDANLLGDWSEALNAAGIVHRDEATGFIYLGVDPN